MAKIKSQNVDLPQAVGAWSDGRHSTHYAAVSPPTFNALAAPTEITNRLTTKGNEKSLLPKINISE